MSNGGVGKEPSAGAGPSTDERGQLQSSPQLQQQRAVLASLAVDPGAHHEKNNGNNNNTSRDGVCSHCGVRYLFRNVVTDRTALDPIPQIGLKACDQVQG